MAELSISRNSRQVPKVDLTAMVDLAFLLITFFMLTTSLSKPNAMDMVKPDETGSNVLPVPASRTMTILLGKNNKLAWYMGEADKSQLHSVSFRDIRKSILANKAKVSEANLENPNKSLIIIVKPTSGANYQNFVDIMDEISLAKITTAPMIDDDNILPAEQSYMLKTNF
jgi:biopolymer transport protein ExbD